MCGRVGVYICVVGGYGCVHICGRVGVGVYTCAVGWCGFLKGWFVSDGSKISKDLRITAISLDFLISEDFLCLEEPQWP